MLIQPKPRPGGPLSRAIRSGLSCMLTAAPPVQPTWQVGYLPDNDKEERHVLS